MNFQEIEQHRTRRGVGMSVEQMLDYARSDALYGTKMMQTPAACEQCLTGGSEVLVHLMCSRGPDPIFVRLYQLGYIEPYQVSGWDPGEPGAWHWRWT